MGNKEVKEVQEPGGSTLNGGLGDKLIRDVTIFKIGQKITHVETGNTYTVTKLPDERCRLEYCNESYYEYVAEHGGLVTWIRCKSEMEDGRFIKHDA